MRGSDKELRRPSNPIQSIVSRVGERPLSIGPHPRRERAKCSTWNMAELNDITEGCGIKESAAPWRTTGRLKRRFAKSLSELIAIFAE
jgi:hypothetical protein